MKRSQVLLLAVLVLLATRAAGAPTIVLTSSDWTVSASASAPDVASPGLNFASSTRQWTTSDALISITAPAFWNVTASVRVPSGQSWPAGVSVYVIRTGAGTGSDPVNGGLTAVGPLPTEPTRIAFFDGKKDRSNIPISLEIRGLTATLPAETYQIEVVYTVN